MYKVSYVVEGLSGGFSDFRESYNSFRDALQVFIARGYADHVNSGSVRIVVSPCDGESCVYSQNVCSHSSTVCGINFPNSIFGGFSHE